MCKYPEAAKSKERFTSETRLDQYSQRLEASLPLDDAGPVFVELAALRFVFDDRFHGDDDRDFDLLRFLPQIISSSSSMSLTI